jgi:hypothetical protein
MLLPMGRSLGLAFGVVMTGLAIIACDGESPPRGPGDQWLEECAADEDCGSTGSCLCGRCTVACTESCDGGPAGTECTRTAGCGTIESGVCVERCVRTSDCADGLVCKGGLCTASPKGEADAGSPDAEAFPGEHHAGADGAWARTLRGYYHVPRGWTSRYFGASASIAPGPEGDLIALLPVDVLLKNGDDEEYVLDDWLIRLDGETGLVEWFDSVPTGARMAADPSGTIVLAWPTLLQVLNSDGTLRWVQRRAPELEYEFATVAVDNAGNVLVARLGLTESPDAIGGDPRGFIDLFKLDPDGNEIFSRRVGDGSGLLDSPHVSTDASNNVLLLAGRVERGADFGGGVLEGNNVLAKYDPGGQHVFSKALGGLADIYSLVGPIRTTPEGNIFCRSESTGPVDIGLGEIFCFHYLFELDGAGNAVSNRCLFVNDYTLLPEGGIATTYQVFDPITVDNDECLPAGLDVDGGLVARYDEAFNPVGHYCNAEMGALPDQVLSAPPGHLFISGAGRRMGKLPGGIELSEGGYLVAKIPVP